MNNNSNSNNSDNRFSKSTIYDPNRHYSNNKESTIGETVLLSSSNRPQSGNPQNNGTDGNSSYPYEPTEITPDSSYQDFDQDPYYNPSGYSPMNYNPMSYDQQNYNQQDYSQNYPDPNYNPMDYQDSQNYDHTQYVDPSYYYDMMSNDGVMYQQDSTNWDPSKNEDTDSSDKKSKKEPINKGIFIGVIIAFVSIIICLVVIIIVLHKSSDSQTKKDNTESSIEIIPTSETDPADKETIEETIEETKPDPTKESVGPTEESIIYLFDESNTCICLFDDTTFIWVKDIDDSSTYDFGNYELYLGEDAKSIMLTNYASYGYTAQEMNELLASYQSNDSVCDLMLLVLHNELVMVNDLDTGASAYDIILFGITDGSFYNAINCDNGNGYYFLIQ